MESSVDDREADLERAAIYKAQRLAAIEQEIDLAQQTLTQAEKKRTEWQRKVPWNVLQEQKTAQSLATKREKNVAREKQNQGYRDHTLRQVFTRNKGVLHAESEKGSLFTIAGVLAGLLVAFLVIEYFHLRVLFGLPLLLLATLVGLAAGAALFDSQFVVDERGDGSVFRK